MTDPVAVMHANLDLASIHAAVLATGTLTEPEFYRVLDCALLLAHDANRVCALVNQMTAAVRAAVAEPIGQQP
jgi:hypothetical protein